MLVLLPLLALSSGCSLSYSPGDTHSYLFASSGSLSQEVSQGTASPKILQTSFARSIRANVTILGKDPQSGEIYAELLVTNVSISGDFTQQLAAQAGLPEALATPALAQGHTEELAGQPMYYTQSCNGQVLQVVHSSRDTPASIATKKALIRHFAARISADRSDHVEHERDAHGAKRVAYSYPTLDTVHMQHDTTRSYRRRPDSPLFKQTDEFFSTWESRTQESHLISLQDGVIAGVQRESTFHLPPERKPQFRTVTGGHIAENGDHTNGQVFFMEAKGSSRVHHLGVEQDGIHASATKKRAAGSSDGEAPPPELPLQAEHLGSAFVPFLNKHVAGDNVTFHRGSVHDLDVAPHMALGGDVLRFPGTETLAETLEALGQEYVPPHIPRQLHVYLSNGPTRQESLAACARIVVANSEASPEQRYEVMRVLAGVGREGEQALLRQVIQDTEAQDRLTRSQALLSLRGLERPDAATLAMLRNMMGPSTELVSRRQAVLVYGMLAENVASVNATAGREMREFIMERWILSVHEGPDAHHLWANAMANAYDPEAAREAIFRDRVNLTLAVAQRYHIEEARFSGYEFALSETGIQTLGRSHGYAFGTPGARSRRKREPGTTPMVPETLRWLVPDHKAHLFEDTDLSSYELSEHGNILKRSHEVYTPITDRASAATQRTPVVNNRIDDQQEPVTCTENGYVIDFSRGDGGVITDTPCPGAECPNKAVDTSTLNSKDSPETCTTDPPAEFTPPEAYCRQFVTGPGACGCWAKDDYNCWVPGFCIETTECEGASHISRQWTEDTSNPAHATFNVDNGCKHEPYEVQCCVARKGETPVDPTRFTQGRKRQSVTDAAAMVQPKDSTGPIARDEQPDCDERVRVEQCVDSKNHSCGLDCVNDQGDICSPSRCRGCVDCVFNATGEQCGELCVNAQGGQCGSPWSTFKDAFAAFFGENLCANVTGVFDACPAAEGHTYVDQRPDEPSQLWDTRVGGEPVCGKIEAVLDTQHTNQIGLDLCANGQTPWSVSDWHNGGRGVYAQCRRPDFTDYRMFLGGFAGVEAYRAGSTQGYDPLTSRFEVFAGYLKVVTAIPSDWNLLEGPQTCQEPVEFNLYLRAGGKVFYFENVEQTAGDDHNSMSCYFAEQTCIPDKPPRQAWNTDNRDIYNKYLPDIIPSFDLVGIPVNIEINIKASVVYHHAIAFAFNELEGGLMLLGFFQPMAKAEASIAGSIKWDGSFGNTEEATEVQEYRNSVELGLRATLEIINVAMPLAVGVNWETSKPCLNVTLESSALGGRVDAIIKIGGVDLASLFGVRLTLWEWEPLLTWGLPMIETACCKLCPGSCQNSTVSGDPSETGGLHSGHARCDFTIGECVCRAGWDGEECMIPCPEDCDRAQVGVWCNPNTPYEDPMIRGRCKCDAGSWGYDCSLACPGGRNNPCNKRTDTEVCFDPYEFQKTTDNVPATATIECGYGGPGTVGCECRDDGAPCNAGLVCAGDNRCAVADENGAVLLEQCEETCESTGVCECWRFPPVGPYFGDSCDVTCNPELEIPLLADGTPDPDFRRCAENGECKYFPNTDHAQCMCYRNFFGPECESTCPMTEDGRDLPCSLRGECTEVFEEAHCLCDLGFYGDVCEKIDFEGSGLALTFPGATASSKGVEYPLTKTQLEHDPANGVTTMAWVQVHEIPTSTATLVSWAWGTLALSDSGHFGLCDANMACTWDTSITVTVNAEDLGSSPWYFVAGALEADANSGVGLRKVYVWAQGSAVDTSATEESNSVARLAENSLFIGPYPFKGMIDHVHVIARMANTEDLSRFSTGTPGFSTPGLLFQALCDTGRSDHDYPETPFIPGTKPAEVYWSNSGVVLEWASVNSDVAPAFMVTRPDFPEIVGYDLRFSGRRASKGQLTFRPVSPEAADGSLLSCRLSAFLIDPAHDVSVNFDDVGNFDESTASSIPMVALFEGRAFSGTTETALVDPIELPEAALKLLRNGDNKIFWQMDGNQGDCNDANLEFSVLNSFLTLHTEPVNGFVQTTGLSEGYMEMTPQFQMEGTWAIEMWAFIEPIRMRAAAASRSSLLLHYQRDTPLDTTLATPNLAFFQLGGSQATEGIQVKYTNDKVARVAGYGDRFFEDAHRGVWFHLMVKQTHQSSSCELTLFHDGETQPAWTSPSVDCGTGQVKDLTKSTHSLRIGASFEGRFNDVMFWKGQIPDPKGTMVLAHSLNPLFSTSNLQAAYLFDDRVEDTVASVDTEMLLPESTGKTGMTMRLVRGVFRGLLFGAEHRWKRCPGVDDVLAPESVCSNTAFQERGVCVLEDEEQDGIVVEQPKCDCHTEQGFIGIACQQTCEGSIRNDDGTFTACSGHGQCVADDAGTSVQCICEDGFAGPGCELVCPGFVYPNGPPGQQVCNGRGSCEYNETSQQAYCRCAASSGYYGLQCEYEQRALPILGCDNCEGLNEVCNDGICDCDHPYYRVGAHCQAAAFASHTVVLSSVLLMGWLVALVGVGA